MNLFLRCSFLTLALWLGACSKLDINKSEWIPSPVFYIHGEINGNKYIYAAGVDSVYLFTDYGPAAGTGSIPLQTGRFSNQKCVDNNCAGSISFVIHGQSGTIQPANKSYIHYATPGNIVYPIVVQPILPDTARKTISVTVGNTINNNNFLPTEANLLSDSSVVIRMSLLDNVNGLKSSSMVNYMPFAPDSCKPVQIEALVEGNSITLRTITTQYQPNITWSNGSNDSNIVADISSGSSYEVTVTSPDAGCSAVATMSQIPEISGGKYQSPAFSVTGLSPVIPTLQEGVEIQWYDSEGIMHTSAGVTQNADSFFTISEVGSYWDNEKNKPTVQLKIRYRCLLSGNNPLGINIVLFSGDGVIAVGVR